MNLDIMVLLRDSITYHNLRTFSTKDNDNDHPRYLNYATKHKDGWWYYICYKSNLNGNYKIDNYQVII